MAALFQSIAALGARAVDAFWPSVDRCASLTADLSPPPAAAAAPAAPPLVLDAHADTLDHVVRAVVHSGFLEEATQLMLASREHLHDPELLYRTRGVRGADGDTLLMRAVMRLDVARAAEILGACPTPATRVELLASVDDDKGRAALHLACSRLRLDVEAALRMVELLLANGAEPLAPQLDPNDEDDVVWHAIHFAACWSARLVQRLVQAGASIDGDVEGTSTFFAAAGAGTLEGVHMIPQLVALGARKTRGNDAMISFATWPAEGAQPTDGEVVAALNALVSVGCSLTQPDGGSTPLDIAAASGNVPVVRALLSLGVPTTTASLARAVKHPDVVRMLLAAGAPPNGLAPVIGNGAPRTPLMAAAQHSSLESLQLLLAAGPGLGVHRRDRTGRTALMCVVDTATGSESAKSSIIEALLEAGADVLAQDHEGCSALHYVARQHSKLWAAAVARLLRDNGASACSVNEDGETPAELIPADQHGGPLHRELV